MLAENSLLARLTAPQHEAVTHIDGPMLVLAGPGSGKTRVITHRVAYMISQGVSAYNILAITFTNKAANEMRQRLIQLGIPRGSTIATFHSLAARLLREHAQRAGLSPNFSIYDDSDQKNILRDALKALELDSKNFPPGKMLNTISGYKNDLKLPEHIAGSDDFYTKTMARIYAAYQKQLQANAALDFDDLLMRLAFLLRDDPELRDQLNQRYRYVLVDEYQDTNHCQYQIARGLSLNHGNLCVTGDPDQSIYGWRGADIGNILAFEEDYPNARVVRLEENFRSTPQVLALADQLISQNQRRKHKRLFTSLPAGAAPDLNEYDNEYAEAEGVISGIEALRQQNADYRQMAIFYRTNSMSRVLEEALFRRRIPYQIVRGIEFYGRAEIKDMLAYLQFLVNPADQVSFKRIINEPVRGIGATTVGRLLDHANQSGQDINHVLIQVDALASINAGTRSKIKKFAELIDTLRNQISQPVAQIIRLVYEQTGMAQALALGQDAEDRHANIEELINGAADYDQETAEDPDAQGSLADYLQKISLISDVDAHDNQAGAVSLMTLHSAKGLEFPAVFIIGVEDGLIPHSRSITSDNDLEEERRLLFVGMTRAQQYLALSYARNRTIHGCPQATIRSPFLRGLDGFNMSSAYASAYEKGPKETPRQKESSVTYEEFHDDLEPTTAFRPGQRVRHPKFGVGRIVELKGNGDDRAVVVQFLSGARKTLVLQFARLEILDTQEP